MHRFNLGFYLHILFSTHTWSTSKMVKNSTILAWSTRSNEDCCRSYRSFNFWNLQYVFRGHWTLVSKDRDNLIHHDSLMTNFCINIYCRLSLLYRLCMDWILLGINLLSCLNMLHVQGVVHSVFQWMWVIGKLSDTLLPSWSCELHRLHMQVMPVMAMSAVHQIGLLDHHALPVTRFFSLSISPTCPLFSVVLLAAKGTSEYL